MREKIEKNNFIDIGEAKMFLGMMNLFSGSTLLTMPYSYFSVDFTQAKALTLIIIGKKHLLSLSSGQFKLLGP